MGRPVGSKNKTTVAIRECLSQVYEGLGGAKAMLEWAKLNPTEFYALWGKQIPRDMSVEHSGGITLEQLVAGATKPDAE